MRSDTRQIVIRLTLDETIDTDDLRELADIHGLVDLRAFLDSYPELQASRVIQHVSPAEVRKREAQSLRTDFPPLETLSTYWRLDAREFQSVDSLFVRLRKMDEVSSAYQEAEVQDACPIGASNPLEVDQGYLNDAPQGVSAYSAWNKPHGSGHGINVIDLESGWILTHEDLPIPAILYNDNGADHQFSSGDHGAAVLGVIGGENNDLGVIGIAPKLASLNVVSHFRATPPSKMHVADAIGAATGHLNAGDILLLEVQRLATVALPTEIHSADLHAIRDAVSKGIIVIEAAGNGNTDLDGWIDPAGEHSLDRDSSDFTDSGAVFVGASTSDASGTPIGHARYFTSNYGNRVDCYAWGERIVTAGYGTLAGISGGNSSYASSFGQTSGASAIIAGVAAVIQGYYQARHGYPLTPVQMRSVLSKRCTGTPQADIAGQPIGVMPNLKKILGWRFSFLRILWQLQRMSR